MDKMIKKISTGFSMTGVGRIARTALSVGLALAVSSLLYNEAIAETSLSTVAPVSSPSTGLPTANVTLPATATPVVTPLPGDADAVSATPGGIYVPSVITPTPHPSNYNFSRVSSKKNTPCDVILILGDSRSCSLIKALWDNDDYESLYYYADRTNAIDAICRKGNRMIVICAEPGGSLKSGAVLRATNRMLNLLNNNANLKNQRSYTFFNMFGLNDCILDKASATGYLSYDAGLIGTLPYCNHVYQLNAGPINKNMDPVPDDEANLIIAKYNSEFKDTAGVTIVDLYSYLMTSGYHTEFSQIDVSGLHYDAETNTRIMSYILGIASNAIGAPNTVAINTPVPILPVLASPAAASFSPAATTVSSAVSPAPKSAAVLPTGSPAETASSAVLPTASGTTAP
ncbi:MAG: hypothetical protein K6A38_02550 [Lachnospiraceae bacterium]|nr:hypothetical protein [Lachnospiraceae bacterium]